MKGNLGFFFSDKFKKVKITAEEFLQLWDSDDGEMCLSPHAIATVIGGFL